MADHFFPRATHPGPRNDLSDVTGVRVGHFARSDGGYLTGTTVVLAPDGGMVAGIDIRGGGPGSRETDLLAPTATVDRVNALVVTGGSAYGLAAASGVMDALSERGVGFPVGPHLHEVVPIVPALVLFDLGRGGDFRARPDAEFGRRAVLAAYDDSVVPADGSAGSGLGAGSGAVAGGLKGGLGQASAVLPNGSVVGAVVAINSAGSAVNPTDGTLWGAGFLDPRDGITLGVPTAAERDAIAAAVDQGTRRPLGEESRDIVGNTTIAILATNVALTKSQCTKLAQVGHDGFARALNPIHTLFDGDAVFAASTGAMPAPDLLEFQQIVAIAPHVVTRAIVRAIVTARGVSTPGGSWAAYRDLAGSAVRD